jgi:ribonucleoside-diphosphate reductase alpha chain
MFTNDFSRELWGATYKDHKDETVQDTLMRVARTMAKAEETEELKEFWREKFYNHLCNFKITVGGRTYSNAGTEWGGTTFINCFVGPNPTYDVDSLDGILKVLRDQAQTLKSEGGWGMNFSFIRPRGAFIHGVGVETPGSVKYMEMFDKSSEIVTSGSGKTPNNPKAKGKIRKGAMMAVLCDWHPDVVEFITAKQTPGRLQKFNVSVGISDEFMSQLTYIQKLEERLKTESDPVVRETLVDAIDAVDVWPLQYPDTTHPKYKAEWNGDLKAWKTKRYEVVTYEYTSVTLLWNLIMESTYNRAEPGVLFLDRANHFNPLSYLETIQATNPCGEQTLAPGGCCNLGSINLTQFMTEDGKFDFESLKESAKVLVRLLDNVNSVSSAPLPEYIDSMRNKRRIGVGVMGWGSLLYMMRIRFGSEKANQLRDEIMQTIALTAYEYSIDLAVEKGSFTYCNPELHAKGNFIVRLGLSDEYMDKLRRYGIRNSSLLSIQPTGNTGIFANVVTGGLEPMFMFEYIRTVILNSVPASIANFTPKYWEGEFVETSLFKWVKEGDDEVLKGVGPDGITYKIDRNRGLTKEVLCEDYGVWWLKQRGLWDSTAEWAVTTNSLNAQDHVQDLIGFARWVDSAISKTVNIPNDYPFEDFKNIYLNAYTSGEVKGVTTYRSGTMMSVLSAKEEKTASLDEEEIILEDVKLPESAPAMVKTLKVEGKKWYLTVVMNESNNRPFALFVTTNVHEPNVTTFDVTERLIALASQKGIPQKHIDEIEQKIKRDSNHAKMARVISLLLRHGVFIREIIRVLDTVENVFVGSFLFQIKKFLSTFIKDGEKVEGEKCQECGSDNIVFSEGCKRCQNCGSSKCG